MILTGLAVGAVLGFVLQRGRFCVTGAFRDVWTIRSSRWISAFLLVIAVHAVGLLALSSAGVITLAPKELPLVATVVGAFIFGFSMILAGGCATGTYYRAGEGLVGSWIALVMYALSASIMRNGPLADATDAARAQTVPATTITDTLGLPTWIGVLALVLGVGALVRHHLTKPKVAMATLPPKRTGLAHLLLEKPWNAFATAVVIGLIATIAWPLSAATGRNNGLGITTPSADLVSFFGTGDTGFIDWGVMLVLGILLGSYVAAKASGEFRVRVPDAKIAVRSVWGGLGMGVGASLAGGCTIGNAMVQTAQLSWQGWISFAVMLLGAGAGARVFIQGRGLGRRRSAPSPAGTTTATTAAATATTTTSVPAGRTPAGVR